MTDEVANQKKSSRIAELLGALAYQLRDAGVTPGQTGEVLLGFMPHLAKNVGQADLIEHLANATQLYATDSAAQPFAEAQHALSSVWDKKSSIEKATIDNPITTVLKVGPPNKRTSITLPLVLVNKFTDVSGSVRLRNKLINELFLKCPHETTNKSKWVARELINVLATRI